MEQSWLAEHAVASLLTIPQSPTDGSYMTLDEANAIVAQTIDYGGRHGDAVEYAYLKGHAKRLAVSLTFVPRAITAGAKCLDVGAFGYMGYWAQRHLGYVEAHGIEWQPNDTAPVTTRTMTVDDESYSVTIYNFDIGASEWPIEGCYDTVLFFETLEHVANDHAGVMANILRRMDRQSRLVMSVPNAISHMTLKQFLFGAPPWNYWFFNPDLAHEPRHQFEYTPIFLKILLGATGFGETAFRTVLSFEEWDQVNELYEIAGAMAIEPDLFGDTLLVQARKVAEEPPIRYPDCLYNGSDYYRSTSPALWGRGENSKQSLLSLIRCGKQATQVTGHGQRDCEVALLARIDELEGSAADAQAVIGQLLANTETLAQAAEDHQTEATRAKDALAKLDEEARDREINLSVQLEQSKEHVEEFTCIIDQLRAAANEDAVNSGTLHRKLQASELERQTQEERMWEALMIADGLLQRALNAEQRALNAEQWARNCEDQAQDWETRYVALLRSHSWRITRPFRAAMYRFPTMVSQLLRALMPLHRILRWTLSRSTLVRGTSV